jgi:hypothetical protein
LSNRASTFVSAFIVTVHGLVAPHPPPLKLPNVDPDAGVALRVICPPSATVVEHDVCVGPPPQSMPVPDTLPEPAPDTVTVKVRPVKPASNAPMSHCPPVGSGRLTPR